MLCLPNTPNSLAEKGRPGEAMRVLQRVRGTSDVHAEFAGIKAAAEYSLKVRLTDAARPDVSTKRLLHSTWQHLHATPF